MKQKSLIVGAVVLFMLICAGPALAAEKAYKIKYGPDEDKIKVKQQSQTRWTLTIDDQKYSLDTEKEGKYEFKKPDGTKYKAKVKGDKVKLSAGETELLSVKFYPNKTKIKAGDGANIWQFKSKGDKIKVYGNDQQLGKVKFYPDKDKLKAKDQEEKEIASLKDLGRLSAVMAPFLMEKDMPQDQRVFLILLFFAMEKVSPDLPVLFVAPGAGLGHLVRVSAVSLALDDLGIGTRIVTNFGFWIRSGPDNRPGDRPYNLRPAGLKPSMNTWSFKARP